MKRMLYSGLGGLLIVGLSSSPSWSQWWPWWNQAVAAPAPPVCPTYGSAVALGLLGGGDTQGYAYGVNSDGSVIVGTSYVAGFSVQHPVTWTNAGPAVQLPFFGSDTSGIASDVSADGTIVVGSSTDAGGHEHPIKWTSGVASELPLYGTGLVQHPLSVSADGAHAVGYATFLGGSPQLAVVWENGTATALPLGVDAGGVSQADHISADGTTIVGYTLGATIQHPVMWTGGAGHWTVTDLVQFPGTSTISDEAFDVSNNGASIIGLAVNSGGIQNASVWTNNGTVRTDLNFDSRALGVSADGNVVSGSNFHTSNILVEWCGGNMTQLVTPGMTAFSNAPQNVLPISDDKSKIVGGYATAGSASLPYYWPKN